MDQVAFPLPIRLLPRKGGQIFGIFFFIFFTGFSVVWMAVAGAATWFNGDDTHWLFKVFPLFGLLFFGVGAAGLLHAIAKLLPGSPYHHLEVASDGLTVRTIRRKQHFAWSQLSPFDVSVRDSRDSEGGKTYTHYVVALQSRDSAMLADKAERYNRAVVRIDAEEFGADDKERNAADLAAWFNSLRELALDRRLSAQAEVSVPPGFRVSIWAARGPSAGVSLSKPASGGVVRR